MEFFGHRLSSTTSLRFTEHGHTIFEFLPSSDKIDYYHFVLERQMPVRFDSQLAFLVGTPGPEWAMLRFKEKGWNRAQEGKWGCFDSAGKAYFRATFSVAQPMEFNYVLMNVRGEGTADIFVNGAQVGTGDRSERIRTYNFNEGRVTDHRIGKTIYAIDAFVDGDMDDIIDPLIYADQQEQLRALGQGEWQRG